MVVAVVAPGYCVCRTVQAELDRADDDFKTFARWVTKVRSGRIGMCGVRDVAGVSRMRSVTWSPLQSPHLMVVSGWLFRRWFSITGMCVCVYV